MTRKVSIINKKKSALILRSLIQITQIRLAMQEAGYSVDTEQAWELWDLIREKYKLSLLPQDTVELMNMLLPYVREVEVKTTLDNIITGTEKDDSTAT